MDSSAEFVRFCQGSSSPALEKHEYLSNIHCNFFQCAAYGKWHGNVVSHDVSSSVRGVILDLYCLYALDEE